MKKILLSSMFALLFAASSVFASNTSLFSYDAEEVAVELNELSVLETYIKTTDNITLTDLVAENNPLLANTNLNPLGAMSFMEPPLGIPSFVWGCVLNWVGIVLVYVIADDRDETMKAVTGCVVNSLFWILWWVLWVLILGGSFWALY